MNSIKSVFLLFHTREYEDGDEDIKLIGVYSTMELAEQTAERYKKLPGFSSAPNGFEISEYAIDKDYWISGYIDMPADDNTKMWAQKDS